MLKESKKILILIIFICCEILTFTACSSSSSVSNEEIKGLITSDIDGVESELNTIKGQAQNATGEVAANLASDTYYLSHRLDDITGTFDKDIEDGYITQDERAEYENRINGLKQEISALIPDLTTKARDAAASINPDAKALIIISKSDLDTLIADDDQLASSFESGIGSASSSTKETFRILIKQRLDAIDSALSNLDKLEADGQITSEEKTGYQSQLNELRKRFDDLNAQLG